MHHTQSLSLTAYSKKCLSFREHMCLFSSFNLCECECECVCVCVCVCVCWLVFELLFPVVSGQQLRAERVLYRSLNLLMQQKVQYCKNSVPLLQQRPADTYMIWVLSKQTSAMLKVPLSNKLN